MLPPEFPLPPSAGSNHRHGSPRRRRAVRFRRRPCSFHLDTAPAITKSAIFRCALQPGAACSVGSEHQGIAAAGLVDEIDRDIEVAQDLPQPADVVANLLWEQRWIGSGLTENLVRCEVPVGMLEQEMQELEFPLGEGHIAASVTDHPVFGIQLQALELPDPGEPQIQALLVSVHLALDYLEVYGGGLLGGRVKPGQVPLHTAQDAAFELQEVGVDAHPVASVLPAIRAGCLPLRAPAPARG